MSADVNHAWIENYLTAHAQPHAWLQSFREKEIKKFLQRGFPHKKEENWKYTDVSSLGKNTYVPAKNISTPVFLTNEKSANCITLVFVNGHFSKELSHTQLLPKEVLLLPLKQAQQQHEALIKPYLLREFSVELQPFACLNSALHTEGVFLFIPKNYQLQIPVHVTFISSQQEHAFICTRNIIVASENSKVTVLEEYHGFGTEHYVVNCVTDIVAEKGAQIHYHKIQNENIHATHIANTHIQQHQDSQVTSHVLSIGSRLAREDLHVNLKERGAHCKLNGLYCLQEDNQHIDHHVLVTHAADKGSSEMSYKGIMDKKSRAVFNGKVYVQQNAKQTHAQQQNHNLLLSALAEVNAKPELEIYADDVKCTHGATIGQLQKEAIFYLCSRGIDKNTAAKLLIIAFAAEIIGQIAQPLFKDKMQQLLDGKLSLINIEYT